MAGSPPELAVEFFFMNVGGAKVVFPVEEGGVSPFSKARKNSSNAFSLRALS